MLNIHWGKCTYTEFAAALRGSGSTRPASEIRCAADLKQLRAGDVELVEKAIEKLGANAPADPTRLLVALCGDSSIDTYVICRVAYGIGCMTDEQLEKYCRDYGFGAVA